jgi:hypothetical protein
MLKPLATKRSQARARRANIAARRPIAPIGLLPRGCDHPQMRGVEREQANATLQCVVDQVSHRADLLRASGLLVSPGLRNLRGAIAAQIDVGEPIDQAYLDAGRWEVDIADTLYPAIASQARSTTRTTPAYAGEWRCFAC